MEKDDSDHSYRISPSNPVKFIIMDSQCDSEDPDILNLPALKQSETVVPKHEESTSLKKLFRDTDSSDCTSSKMEKKSVCVLESDSDIQTKPVEKDAANSSSESIVVGESEDQMEVTVIERKASGSTTADKEEDKKSDSCSSFASNSKQSLGKYSTAEMSHSQGAKVRGHLFPVDSSEVDLFSETEGEDMISTPAKHIGSLQLSSKPMLVPETMDEEEIFAVSPSQDNFPHVIPSSPTSDKEEDYDPIAEQTLSGDIDKTMERNISQKDKNRSELDKSSQSSKQRTGTQESIHKSSQSGKHGTGIQESFHKSSQSGKHGTETQESFHKSSQSGKHGTEIQESFHKSSQSGKHGTETQESFHLKFSCSEIEASEKQKMSPKKNVRCCYSKEMVKAALDDVRINNMTIRGSARLHGVPESTLRRRLNDPRGENVSPGGPTLFTNTEETQLAQHCTDMAEKGYRFTRSEIIELAKNMSAAKEKYHTPTKHWFYGFVNRFPQVKMVQSKKRVKPRVTEKSQDVIVISQDEEEQDMDIEESQEFALHLSPSQSTERGSKSTDSKSLSEGNEGFHIKVPREVEGKRSSQSQGDKPTSQPNGKLSPLQKSSQSHAVEDEDMVTQTPQDMLRKEKSVEIISCEMVQGDTMKVPVKQTPSLTIEMIETVESQVSEHSFNLNRPDVHVIDSEQYSAGETKADVFRKIKSSEKSSRYVIHDDSDDEVTFKSTTGKETEKLSDEDKDDTRPKLKMSRTMSSELTSTGYQASIENSQSSVLPEDITTLHRGTTSSLILQKEDTVRIIEGGLVKSRDQIVNQGGDIENTESVVDGDKTQSYDTEKYLSTSDNRIETGQGDTNRKGIRGNETASHNLDKQPTQPVVDTNVQKNTSLKVNSGKSKSDDVTAKQQNSEMMEGVSILETAKNVNKNAKEVTIKPAKSFKEMDRNIRSSKQSSKNQQVIKQSKGAQNDPYEFHGSESQVVEDQSAEINPLDYYKKRKPPPPVVTPPSSRKRKRMVHKKTGLKTAKSKKPATDKPHVYFSSPVSESLTTPPSDNQHAKAASSSGTKHPVLNLRTEVTPIRSIPTRAGQQISSTFSPPMDRIEEDFPNVTTQVTLHRKPLVSSQEQIATTSEMRPPTSVPPIVKSPSTSTSVSSVNTTSASGSSSLLTRPEHLLQQRQSDAHKDAVLAGQDIKLKTITTTITSYKKVETVEKVLRSDGTVQILSQYTEKFARPVKTKTYTETIEEDYVESPISPSRTNSTVTSGDLGDISSSLSRSGSSGPSSLEAHRVTSDIVVSQSSETISTRKSPDKAPVNTHHVSLSDTYSPLDVSSIHKSSDRRLSSENLFTSPDTSKGEEEVKKAESSFSDGITCAQRNVVEQGQRSGEESEPLFTLPKATTTGSSTDSNYISPEIPNQDQAISTTKPENQEDMASTKRAVQKDTRIMAKWKDSHFYPGVIKEVMGKSRYRVQFDDGDVLIIKGCDILLLDKLPVGQPVMVLSNDGYFYPGIITAETKKGDIIQYTVDQDNGKSGKFRYSQVILSEDQAACIIADLQCQLSEPSVESEEVIVKNPNVSLENLVIGKRRKESKYEQLNMSTEEEGKAGPSSVKKRKSPFSPTPVKGRKAAPTTSTPRVAKRRKVTEDSELNSTPPTSAVQSPITPRRSPRKAGKSASKSSKLFQGYYFMLTHVDKTTESTAIEKEVLRDSSIETSADESGHEDDNRIPFDKDFLKKTTRSEGGVILDKITKQSKLKSPVFLISDMYHRTPKYFQSLAAGIPCVSHLWIRDSVHQKKLLDYKSYILQAGISVEKKKVVEWNSRRGELNRMTIMVESQKDKMVEEWTNIFNIADVNVVDKLHNKKDKDGIVQVLVTDSTCSAQVLRSAKSLNVPVVSTEWAIQCLINGQVMNFTGHPRYQYDFDVI